MPLWMKTLLLFLLLASLIFFLETQFSAISRGTDFPDFYCASRMLIEGHGAQLYDVDLQRQYQARYAQRVGTLYIHPPFETVVYLAVAWLPLKQAYLLWCVLNVALLAFVVHRAQRENLVPWNWNIVFVASLTFAPVLLCLLQGQDSILLLVLVTLAFAALRRQKRFAAGCWLGLGLFKFQLVLPIALVLAMQKGRSRFARGFLLVALALTGISAAISGWSVLSAYPKFLLHLHEQQFAGVTPQAMANFRGLASLIFSRSSFLIASLIAFSTTAFVVAVLVWQMLQPPPQNPSDSRAAVNWQRFDWAFAATVLFALLASYHLNPHDLSLLLLPIAVLLRDTITKQQSVPTFLRWLTIGLCTALFLPPLHLLVAAHLYAPLAIPLIALFAASVYGVLREEMAPLNLESTSPARR